MDIAWFRDLIICISGLVSIVVLIFIAVLSYSFYRKAGSVIDSMSSFYRRTGSVLDSIEATSATMKGVVCSVRDEMVSPMVQVLAIVQGIRQGINIANKFFRKKEEGGENG